VRWANSIRWTIRHALRDVKTRLKEALRKLRSVQKSNSSHHFARSSYKMSFHYKFFFSPPQNFSIGNQNFFSTYSTTNQSAQFSPTAQFFSFKFHHKHFSTLVKISPRQYVSFSNWRSVSVSTIKQFTSLKNWHFLSSPISSLQPPSRIPLPHNEFFYYKTYLL